MSGALRGVPAKGVGAYLLANSAVGGVAPLTQKNINQQFIRHKNYGRTTEHHHLSYS